MKYIDILKLYENKDSRINKLDNLTDEQKEEVKAFFRLHPEQESKIDWNKTSELTYENFKKVINNFSNSNTKSAQKKIANKVGIEGLTEGKDYEYLGEYTTKEFGTFRAYVPLSWLGAKTIAGRKVPPVNEDKDSAAWCIGYSSDNYYWNLYFYDRKGAFVIICGDDVPTKKVCFEIMDIENNYIICWNYYDKSSDIVDFFYRNFNIELEDMIVLDTYNLLNKFFSKAVELSDARRLIDKTEQQKELENYRNSLPTKNFAFNGYDFPFFQVGTRHEGKVFMSKYLINIRVPFSPRYHGRKYNLGCNHWDISIVRQWLNSDAPAGQWYKEYEVEGYKIDWNKTDNSTKDFISNTPGFLRIIGISKSDLNPVTNVTYTIEGEPIETVDYTWIPSLSEMSTKNSYNEGEPLEYWKKVLENNANLNPNENRILKDCSNSSSKMYWLRSINSDYSEDVEFVCDEGYIDWYNADYASRVAVLACFKD